ncbi:amidohydrolase family protein [Desulfovibrio inopinatus]|uniref:amidohydrolase family protein n=1 Tax=Desulfovibrio inopinatus TaxID=102109 RepID=UPI000428625A|nr:amidohydrolase family protein [Desulfovibrio inopinatus]
MLLADGFYRIPRLVTMHGEDRLREDMGCIVHAGRFTDVGPYAELARHTFKPVELSNDIYGPAFINSHCHLELSFLRGQAPRGLGFEGWVAWLIQQKPASPEELDVHLDTVLSQAKESGTVSFADITSRAVEHVAAAIARNTLDATLFYEFFGFTPPPETPFSFPARFHALTSRYDSVRLAPAGHALYSTHPETLRRAKAYANAAGLPFSLHLAEHPGEIETLATGRGAFADMLRVRVIPKDFTPPGMSPVAYADSLGLLDANTLVVHAVHVDNRDLTLLQARRVTVCLCPRSNAYIGVGEAPVRQYLDHGLPLCVGTDSLASNDDLDIGQELSALEHLAGRALTPQEAFTIGSTTPARLLAPQFGCIASSQMAAVASIKTHTA